MQHAKNQRLRALLDRPGIVTAAGVYDAVSARIAEQCGFEALYMTGNGVTASLIGKPDIGLTTLTEMTVRAHQIAACTDVPLLCDADTGYGNLNNVKRTVEEYESLGISAIHLEDQTTPKKCGAMEGLTLIPAEEAAEKIRVAAASRLDPDFLIIARTDCASLLGPDEAVRRCKLFAQAGADLVYPEMLRTPEDILKVTTAVDVPVMFDILELPPHPAFTVPQLEKLGVKLAFNCLSAMFATCATLQSFYSAFRATGSTEAFGGPLMGLHEYERLMDLPRENSLRERVCSQP